MIMNVDKSETQTLKDEYFSLIGLVLWIVIFDFQHAFGICPVSKHAYGDTSTVSLTPDDWFLFFFPSIKNKKIRNYLWLVTFIDNIKKVYKLQRWWIENVSIGSSSSISSIKRFSQRYCLIINKLVFWDFYE